MSIAMLSAEVAQKLLDIADRKAVEANPFVVEDGVPKIKFDGMTVERIGSEIVMSFLWQGTCTFTLREPCELAPGDKMHVRGLLGTMGMSLH